MWANGVRRRHCRRQPLYRASGEIVAVVLAPETQYLVFDTLQNPMVDLSVQRISLDDIPYRPGNMAQAYLPGDLKSPDYEMKSV